jgi:hypothetical protein
MRGETPSLFFFESTWSNRDQGTGVVPERPVRTRLMSDAAAASGSLLVAIHAYAVDAWNLRRAQAFTES